MVEMSNSFRSQVEGEDVQQILANNPDTNYFISGRAGTGKTYTLVKRAEILEAQGKSVARLAFTGIAASHLKGQTMHSFFRIDIAPALPGKKAYLAPDVIHLLAAIDEIHIDEVSMLRIDVFETVFAALYDLDRCPRIVVAGDFAQLEPVITSRDRPIFISQWGGRQYAFESDHWSFFERYHLLTIYRQVDPKFINLLECLRQGQQIPQCVQVLNDLSFDMPLANLDLGDAVYIAPLNMTVDGVNASNLSRLHTPLEQYAAIKTGKTHDNDCVAPDLLRIKPGARVMLLKNNRAAGYYNGSLGHYIGMSSIECKAQNGEPSSTEPAMKIRLNDGRTILAPRGQWDHGKYTVVEKDMSTAMPKAGENLEVEREITGSISQFPVTLAWALTAHKAQGSTFDNIIIGPGAGFFAFGQFYVALSRCRTIEGVRIHGRLKIRDVAVNQKVLKYEYI